MISLSTIPTAILIISIALPVAFIAMNPAGALQIVTTTGQFMIVTVMDIVKGGMAVLWWVMQAIGVNIGNLFIWIGNMLISLVNSLPNALNNILPDWMDLDVKLIPQIEYLKMPPIDPVISNIIDEIMDGYTNLRLKISDYWSTVQANAPTSYVVGAGAGGGAGIGTWLLTKPPEVKPRKPEYNPKPKPKPKPKNGGGGDGRERRPRPVMI